MTTIPPTAGKRHFIVRTAVMATGLALCAAGVSAHVSYTHLTLPTICSV